MKKNERPGRHRGIRIPLPITLACQFADTAQSKVRKDTRSYTCKHVGVAYLGGQPSRCHKVECC